MEQLSRRERDLVALGAALGSNCVPCVERYVTESRAAGVRDEEISEAIGVADRVRSVPAKNALDAAVASLAAAAPDECASGPKCCG